MRCAFLILLFAFAVRAADYHPSLPPIGSLEGLGVNIHFTDPKPGELEMIAAAGFKWVRMDLTWAATERSRGEYDFSAFDRLVAALEKSQLRAVFILDYGNPLYAEPDDKHPFTSRAGSAEFREAYGKWAAAAVSRFKGKRYLWELWNEPNIAQFWKPKPNAADYIAVAKAASEAIHKAAPGEAIIGPATSKIDLPFLEECFQAGLLEHWAGVSVHPYRQTAPETVEDEYRSLRLLIRRYAPAGKNIPILSGEWGYSTAWSKLGKDEAAREETQAKYLARMFLTNIANDVPLSIWYDWRDDGDNPKEGEHRFGLVRRPYHENRDPVFDRKPAYQAAKTLTGQLAGMMFNKRLQFGWPGFVPLLFNEGVRIRIAFWSGSYRPPMDWIPASPGEFSATDLVGTALPPVVVQEKETPNFKVTDGPKYFAPHKPNDILRLAAAWDRLPLELVLEPDKSNAFSYTIVNPLDRAITIDGPGSRPLGPGERRIIKSPFGPSRQERTDAYLGFIVPGLCHLSQMTVLIASKPLRVVPLPVVGDTLPVRLENPSGSALRGSIEVYYQGSSDAPEFGPIASKPKRAPLSFTAGRKTRRLAFLSAHRRRQPIAESSEFTKEARTF